MAQDPGKWLIPSLHYIYPAVVFLYFATTTIVAFCTLTTTSAASKAKHAKLTTIISLLLLCLVSYLGQLVLRAIEGFLRHNWPSPDTTVGLLSCVLVYGIELSTLQGPSSSNWLPLYGSWCIALALEPIIAVLSILDHASKDLPRSAVFLWVDIAFMFFRYVTLLLTVLTYFLWRSKAEIEGDDNEQTPLIRKPDERLAQGDEVADSGYGTNSEENTDALS